MTDMETEKAIAKAVLERYPQTYAEMLGIDLARNTPAPLFQWLNCALLMSARISASRAHQAAGALLDEGLTTPDKVDESRQHDRVEVLNKNGYARYDESAARSIWQVTAMLKEEYGGDLRALRKAADFDPEKEKMLLKKFKGIGDVGADIFLREVQVAWDELYPFADTRAARAAENLGLKGTPAALAKLAGPRENLPRLLEGLIRAVSDNAQKEILEAA